MTNNGIKLADMTHVINDDVSTARQRVYSVTKHAINRTVERLGVAREHAANHVEQLMQTAYYQGMTGGPNGNTKVFDHYKTKTRIVTDELAETIITVYKFPEPGEIVPNDVIGEYLRPIINRELRKARRKHIRTVRALELEKAHEMAQLAEMAMNHANARNPNTRNLIEARMDDVRARMYGIDCSIAQSNEEYAKMRKGLEVYAAVREGDDMYVRS